jgi:hypothetical protein
MFRIKPVSAFIFLLFFITSNVYAFIGHIQSGKGEPYTITFTDEKKNTVTGKFKNPVLVEWDEKQWRKKQGIKIIEWDKEATFIYEDKEGKKYSIPSDVVRKRTTYLSPNFWGKLKGDIRDVIEK